MRKVLIFAATAVAILMVFGPLRGLVTSSESMEYYSHIMLIPFVSGYFFYLKRKELSPKKEYTFGPGIVVAVIGITLYFIGKNLRGMLNENDYCSLIVFSGLVFWVGAFILVYGTRGLSTASFPLLFLLFLIPIPSVLMEKIIYGLQVGSVKATELLLALSGVPFMREGFIFHLPGINIEVAKQCSGIRSSLALFITAIFAGHLFLRGGWKKVILALSVFPITVFKNGIRITTLSLLGVYVDKKFITQSLLHSSGGYFFFIPALVLLGIVLWFLRKREKKIGEIEGRAPM
jgi:exosortase